MAKNKMNRSQELWWQQANSDFSIWRLLNANDAGPCHQLHYLQMLTEKISKAYFWRTGKPPRKSHVGFVDFLRSLGSRSLKKSERNRIAAIFGFKQYEHFESWMHNVTPLIHELERLAPALAGDGPNPEYPWPYLAPQHSPTTYPFHAWTALTSSTQGRSLIKFVETAVKRFAEYG